MTAFSIPQNAQSTLDAVNDVLKYSFETEEFAKHYSSTFKQAFDYMIMEKNDNTIVLPANIGWSDVGTFHTIYELSDKDENANSLEGKVVTNNVKNSLIINRTGKVIALHGLQNVIVVEIENVTMINTVKNSDDLKKLVES